MSRKGTGKLIAALLVIAVLAGGYLLYRVITKPVLKPVPAKELITLYFYNPDTDTLKPEQRTVAATTGVLDKCRTIVSELEHGSIAGLESPIPHDVKVNNATLQPNGILNLDLTGNLVMETPEGSSAEIAAIYAIVNSIAKNIKGVKAVQLTIDGKTLQTLETHIEIDRPIVPDYTK